MLLSPEMCWSVELHGENTLYQRHIGRSAPAFEKSPSAMSVRGVWEVRTTHDVPPQERNKMCIRIDDPHIVLIARAVWPEARSSRASPSSTPKTLLQRWNATMFFSCKATEVSQCEYLVVWGLYIEVEPPLSHLEEGIEGTCDQVDGIEGYPFTFKTDA